MTREEIAAARALADAATPGPWKSNCRSVNNPNGDPSWPEDDFLQFHVGTDGGGDIDIEGLVEGPKPVDWGRGEVYGRDAAFIAASRTIVPKLCDIAEKHGAMVESLTLEASELNEENKRFRESLARACELLGVIHANVEETDATYPTISEIGAFLAGEVTKP